MNYGFMCLLSQRDVHSAIEATMLQGGDEEYYLREFVFLFGCGLLVSTINNVLQKSILFCRMRRKGAPWRCLHGPDESVRGRRGHFDRTE